MLIKPSRRLFLKKAIIAAPALITSPSLVEAFWQSRDSNYNQNIVSGGSLTPTTWNPSDKSSGITLSGSNLIATNSSGSGIDGVRSVDAISGKIYFEVVWTVYPGSAGSGVMLIGIGNATATLTTGLLGNANAGGYRDDNLVLYNFGGSPGSPGTSGLNSNIGVAVDTTAKKLWVRKDGGSWDGGSDDPATNTGGLDLSSISGAIYALHQSNAFSYASTAKFDSASWAFTAPSGFGVLGH